MRRRRRLRTQDPGHFRFLIFDWRLKFKIENLKSKIPISLLLVLLVQMYATVNSPCISQTGDDLAAIRELLLTLERGYEDRDVEKYASIFSDEAYEYVSDMTTPDDPSDDIHLQGAESERRSATRVFGAYENLDLEMTDPEIIIDGDSAEARNEFRIVFVRFEVNPNIPSICYAGGANVFSLRRIKGEWGIVRWQQHEIGSETLAAKMQEERKNKGVEDLIRDLGDNRLATWAIALSDLRKLRGAAAKHLIDAVANNSDKNVRIRAAKVLYGTRDEDAVRALTGILEGENDDVDVRAAAASALSECSSQMVEESLLIAAKGADPKLKSAASLALARRIRRKMDDVYQIAVTGLQHEDEAVRQASAESLGVIMSTRGANMLEQRLEDRSESENVRLAALESLKQLKSESQMRLLRDVMKDKAEAEQIRIHAARALAEARDYEVLESLIDVAKSKREVFELRKEAIVALGTMGSSKAVKPLIDLLDSSDAGIRRGAARSLKTLGDRRALKPLIMTLMDKNEDTFVRRLAGEGIVKIDRGKAFGPLVQIMNDRTENALVRRMAALNLAFGDHRSPKDDRAISPFTRVLRDRESPLWLRKIALNYLTSLSHLRRFRYSDSYVEALEAAAGDPDGQIAEKAQETLNLAPATMGIRGDDF